MAGQTSLARATENKNLRIVYSTSAVQFYISGYRYQCKHMSLDKSSKAGQHEHRAVWLKLAEGRARGLPPARGTVPRGEACKDCAKKVALESTRLVVTICPVVIPLGVDQCLIL